MTDTLLARTNMVYNQIYPNHVPDHNVLETMLTLPRENFVPKEYAGIAYIDNDIPIGKNRYLMDPLTFARLAQLAQVTKKDTVLDLGCGTGYSTAVLSALAKKVIALEENEDLASTANYTLNHLGITNIIIISERLNTGHPEGGPYDVIFLNGAIRNVPPLLFSQLADNGRLIAVLRQENGLGNAILFERHGDTLTERHMFETNTHPAQLFDF